MSVVQYTDKDDILPRRKYDPVIDRDKLVEACRLFPTLKAAARSLGIDATSVYSAVYSDPAFKRECDAALAFGMERLGDELLDIHAMPLDPALARLASDNIRFFVERRLSGMYGQRKDISISAKIDLSSAFQHKRQSAMARIKNAGRVITAPILHKALENVPKSGLEQVKKVPQPLDLPAKIRARLDKKTRKSVSPCFSRGNDTGISTFPGCVESLTDLF